MPQVEHKALARSSAPMASASPCSFVPCYCNQQETESCRACDADLSRAHTLNSYRYLTDVWRDTAGLL